ncbi:MAG: serine/threonine-protein kinase [bacterium]
MDQYVGRIIDGRYRIVAPLAAGAMGSVFLAEQQHLHRQVAIKILTSDDKNMVERFRREAEALSSVYHPAIIEVYDFVSPSVLDDDSYLVMSYVKGMDLEDYKLSQPEHKLAVHEVVPLLLPVASALVELHANGILHRDIKPANIVRFMRADGRPGVKLVDFGIARRVEDPSITRGGKVMGSPPYLPPEVIRTRTHLPVSDVFSLGASLCELVTGEPPFGRDDLARIVVRILEQPVVLPPAIAHTALGTLLYAMLEKDPAARPDALNVVRALERLRS